MKCLPILLDSPFYFKRKQTLLLTINNQSKSFNDVPVIADNNFLHTHTLSNALRYLHSTTEFIHFVIPNAYIHIYICWSPVATPQHLPAQQLLGFVRMYVDMSCSKHLYALMGFP